MTVRQGSEAMTDLAAVLPPDRGGLLVVDDEPFLRDAVAASLRFLGFEVTTAQTGAGALRLARDRSFDLVVLDVMLPDADGFEVVRRLREDGLRVPVIYLTTCGTTTSAGQAPSCRPMSPTCGASWPGTGRT